VQPAFNKPYRYISDLAILEPAIDFRYCGIEAKALHQREVDAMLGEIGTALRFIPFEHGSRSVYL
jgi:hypothetical protein